MKKYHQISIFSNSFPSRLRYANYLVFELILGLKPVEYKDLEAFESLNGPKINYSSLKITNSFHIKPADLLFEDSIHEIELNSQVTETSYFIFSNQDEDIPFDPLAASFYIASRYEEYLTTERDKHDRFPASKSILSKLDCLKEPIIHVWARQLKDALSLKFPTLKFRNLKFSYIPSFDIDMAWSYKAKGTLRTLGAIVKDIISFDLATNRKRFKVLIGSEKDPFDTLNYIKEQTKRHSHTPIFFFLMGKHSKYDKNTDPSHPKFVKLIKELSIEHQVGIHPSYYSSKNLKEEIKSLKKATQTEIETSRQHYIKLKLPETYRNLIGNNITNDYSMGYPDKLGFRNGLAVPSLWYDLEKEQITNLMVHPFQVMDVTLKNYLQLSPEEASKEIKTIVKKVSRYGGTLISIWHNSSFDKDWKGWQKVFEEMLSYASEHSDHYL